MKILSKMLCENDITYFLYITKQLYISSFTHYRKKIIDFYFYANYKQISLILVHITFFFWGERVKFNTNYIRPPKNLHIILLSLLDYNGDCSIFSKSHRVFFYRILTLLSPFLRFSTTHMLHRGLDHRPVIYTYAIGDLCPPGCLQYDADVSPANVPSFH